MQSRLAGAVRVNRDGPLLGRQRPVYELAGRVHASAHGGLGVVASVVERCGLAGEINGRLSLLAAHRPYWESDHVLNLAYNALCGGERLEDIEARRADTALLAGLGVDALPDPTTAGDFCRRLDATSIMALQDAINAARAKVWAAQRGFAAGTARIDADASIVATGGETKEGMDISYNGRWGYSSEPAIA